MSMMKKHSVLLREQGHHSAAQAPSNMASPAHILMEAKLKAARAVAAVACAELKVAQATVALAQVELELAESGVELRPETVTTPLSEPRSLTAYASESTSTPFTITAPSSCAPQPSSTFAAASDQAAPRAGLGIAARAGLRFATASASGSSATASGSASVSGNAGEFWNVGNGIRLRAWYICRGGGDSHRCNTFTLAPGWGVNWSQALKQCCRLDCGAKYKTTMGMIGQLQVHAIDYFVRLDCHDWYEGDVLSKLQDAVASSVLALQSAQLAVGPLRPRTFDSLFRMATVKEVKDTSVNHELTFILHNEQLFDELPHWSWSLLCGVIKHNAIG